MSTKSKYTLVCDNISSMTRSSDVKHEFARFGPVLDIEIDRKARCGLVEFKRSADAEFAWRKMDRFYMDGRKWKVDWATKEDFKFLGWKWTEAASRSPSPSRRSPSPSRSRSRSNDSRSPGTPSNKNSS